MEGTDYDRRALVEEVNNRLGIIVGHMELALRDAEVTEGVSEHLRGAIAEARSLGEWSIQWLGEDSR